MFNKGFVKEAFQFFEYKISGLVGEVQDTEEEGCQAERRLELIKLRLVYAKLMLKAGLLIESREQIDQKVLTMEDLPLLLKAKAYYISGKLCFFENSYTQSIHNYQSVIDMLSNSEQFDQAD